MIRPAKFSDIPAIEKLIRRQHAMSKYAQTVAINDKALTQLCEAAVAGMNQNGPCGSHVSVATFNNKITGVLIGSLNRVYNIGQKLIASDIFFINEGKAVDTFRLIDKFIDWALSNPKVVAVSMSWSDALPGSERVAKLYERKGFTKFGELYELAASQERRLAA